MTILSLFFRSCIAVVSSLAFIGCLGDSSDYNFPTTSLSTLASTVGWEDEVVDLNNEYSLEANIESASLKTRRNFTGARNPFQYGPAEIGGDHPSDDLVRSSGEPIGLIVDDGPSNGEAVTFKSELRLIGLVDVKDSGHRIAVFSDGYSVLQGRLNEVIGGQYLIKKIMVSSVEVEILSVGETRNLPLEGV